MLSLTDLSHAFHASIRTRRRVAATCLGGALLLFLGQTPSGPTSSDFTDPLVAPSGIPTWSLQVEAPVAPKNFPRKLFRFPVTVTAYSSTRDQTDSTPFVTASNTRVRPGIVALSRDLLREFTPGAPFSYGDRVEIEGVGTFLVEDTMHKRYEKRVDIWFASRAAARRWGRRDLTLAGLSPHTQTEGLLAQNSQIPLFAEALSE